MSVLIPINVQQRDGSVLQWSNCNMATHATLLQRHQGRSYQVCTGAKMRSHQFDQSGGTDQDDAATAWWRGHRETLIKYRRMAFADLIRNLRSGMGATLSVQGSAMGQYGYCSVAHQIYLNHLNAAGDMVYEADPLRPGFRWVPVSVLRHAAGQLYLGAQWGRVGLGLCYATFSRPTAVLPPTSTSPVGVIPVLSMYEIVANGKKYLRAGQPLYSNGKVVAKMGKAQWVSWRGQIGLGRSGGNWHLVHVTAASPWVDKQPRETALWVPASAGATQGG